MLWIFEHNPESIYDKALIDAKLGRRNSYCYYYNYMEVEAPLCHNVVTRQLTMTN